MHTIKHHMRNMIERILRRLPVSRAAYVQLSILQTKIDFLEVALLDSGPSPACAEQIRRSDEAAARDRPGALKSCPAAFAFPASLLTAPRFMDLRGGLLSMTEDCALGNAGDTLLLPFDEVMFPLIMKNKGWSLETLAFLAERINPAQTYLALDIGANIGLFTRQAALRFKNITHFFCVEAEPGNFRNLQYNVYGLLGDRSTLFNVALSRMDGEMEFFRDRDNFGNYSLNRDAMRGHAFDSIIIQTVETNHWMREHIRLNVDDRLIWKSDTQGYDEVIISLTPLDIWNKVDMAIVELWRINKPDFDRAEFCLRLEAFPNKTLGIDNRCTSSDILEYLQGDDYAHTDLYLWR